MIYGMLWWQWIELAAILALIVHMIAPGIFEVEWGLLVLSWEGAVRLHHRLFDHRSYDPYVMFLPEDTMSEEAKFGTTQAGPRSAVEMSPTASAARDLEVATAIVKDLERKSQDVRDELSGAIRNRDQAEQKLAEVVLPQMKDTTIEQHLKTRIERERRPVRE